VALGKDQPGTASRYCAAPSSCKGGDMPTASGLLEPLHAVDDLGAR